MDGVLVDGEPLHFAAVNRLLGEEGKTISLEAYKPYMGTKTGWQEMIAAFALSQPMEHYSRRYREMILQSYRDHSEALPGAVEVVRAIQHAGIPLAVASSSILPWVEACLTKLGLLDAFNVVVSGSDVAAGKPAPDIYLAAAERLSVAARECLAFEDAPAGIESAHAAGMTCWAVRTEYTRGLALPGPEREFESLLDVDLRDVIGVAA